MFRSNELRARIALVCFPAPITEPCYTLLKRVNRTFTGRSGGGQPRGLCDAERSQMTRARDRRYRSTGSAWRRGCDTQQNGWRSRPVYARGMTLTPSSRFDSGPRSPSKVWHLQWQDVVANARKPRRKAIWGLSLSPNSHGVQGVASRSQASPRLAGTRDPIQRRVAGVRQRARPFTSSVSYHGATSPE